MVTDETNEASINLAASLTHLLHFKENNTKNWFLQYEVIFLVWKITSQKSKFDTSVTPLQC